MIAKVYHVKDDLTTSPTFPNDYEWVADVELYCEDVANIDLLLDDVYRLTNHSNCNWTKNKKVVLFNTEDENGMRSTYIGDVVKVDDKYYICRRSGWDVIPDYTVNNSVDSQKIRATNVDGLCPDCGEEIPFNVQDGNECVNCGHAFYLPPVGPQITTFSPNADGTASGNLVVDMSDISPGAFLEIHVTDEGIIYDYWEQDPNAPIGNVRFVGSNTKMYTEIAEDIVERFNGNFE